MKRRAAWVPLVNTAIGPWARAGRTEDPISVLEELARDLEKTDQRVDRSFLEGMTALWHAFARAEGLSPIGRLALRRDIVRRLAIRMRVAEQAARRPGALAQRPLRQPIFVIGLPRSGTTLLHRLLADAPGLRAPLLYELLDPQPPGRGERWRMRRASLVTGTTHALAPAMRSMHPLDARRPEECSFLLPHGLFHHARARVPGYLQWLAGRDITDLTEDYRYFGQQLRLMDDDEPSRWVLKCPAHLWSLEALLRAFPDATLVWVHRDPLTTLPSWCSLTEATMGMHSDRVDLRLLGRDWLRLWSQAVTRAIRAREAADPVRFIDVSYTDLTADAAQTTAGVLARLGGNHRPAEPARGRERPAHRYELHRYGLDPTSIQHAFSGYLTRFSAFTIEP